MANNEMPQSDSRSDSAQGRPAGPSRRTVLGAGLAAGAVAAGQSMFGAQIARAASNVPSHLPVDSPLPVDFLHNPPFSFTYDGQVSSSLLAAWPATQQAKRLDGNRIQHTVAWTSTSGLRVTCVGITYTDFPVVEWTVYFTNASQHNTPPLSDVLAVDMTLTGPATSSWTVHTNHGSSATANDFTPAAIPLTSSPGEYQLFSTVGGKPTSEYPQYDRDQYAWPYYNVDWGSGGAIIALGWPAQWGVQMSLDSDGLASVLGGMTSYDGFFTGAFTGTPTLYDMGLTDMYLEPGEQIRTPLIVTMSWHGGDWIDAQNTWRRWILAHNTPRLAGRVPAPISAAAMAEPVPAVEATAQTYMGVMAAYDQRGLTPRHGGKLGWLWIDTGWFPIPDSVDPNDPLAWSYTGTWEPDPPRFPHGMREITDEVRSFGGKTIVWHEPERTRPGTWLCDNRAEWLLANGDPQWRYLDWGNAEAYNWALERFSNLIGHGGIELFRIDFNYDGPLPNWNATDTPGRRGATQAHWVVGFLSFLDELRKRHPSVLIESCASGGRRLDIETLRRCVSLTTTDDFRDSLTSQGVEYGLSQWFVCHGNSADAYSTYGLRSAMGWHLEAHLNSILTDTPPTEAEWAVYAAGINEWAEICDNYVGDFYPLTEQTTSDSAWMAYQFDRQDTGTGIAQVFARPSAPAGAMTVQLRGLVGTASYEVRDLDDPTASTYTGHQLMTTGITVAPTERPYAVTISYRRR